MRSTIFALIFMICAASYPAAAREGSDRGIDLTAEVDKGTVNIGDRITLRVTADKAPGMEMSFPGSFEDPGEFTLVGSAPISERGRVGRQYVMSIYTTGAHVIPPLTVGYKTREAVEWNVAESPQVPIEVESVLTGEETDIRALKGLIAFGRKWFLYVLALLILLAAGGISWFLWKKRAERIETEAMRRKTAYEVAYSQLKELKAMDLPGQGRIQEYYTRLSDIVRRYLENRFSLRAPEMTTEEFLDAVKRSSVLIEEHKDILKEFLSHCDMVKFARYGPSPLEMLDSYNAAERMVEQTRPQEEEAEE